MCDWEEFLFACNHSTLRLKSYCHFARNDPNHQCFGVKVLRKSWRQCVPCDNCAITCRASESQTQHNYNQEQSLQRHGG
ncbi:uncharacterized protein FOBCDRAFT_223142 [Fusarium oxysporum Fo47]|uniref:uncharacterized protein n=1 Tax=Fusarium oxysporum Fo47 TaxID=660027 RepID=UPI002869EB47|nr:uncharacterized protein FOBCDRAFT_223142 [Fusarium oxysporum Fo47]WJG35323.1 hypothetical protein FOBCDRAFT_223142 [Fusarium oxysporum Fo47]